MSNHTKRSKRKSPEGWFDSSFMPSPSKIKVVTKIFKVPEAGAPKGAKREIAKVLVQTANSIDFDDKKNRNKKLKVTTVEKIIKKKKPPVEEDDENRDVYCDDFSHFETPKTHKKATGINVRDFEPKTSKELVISHQKCTELKKWFQKQFADFSEEASTSTASSKAASPFLLLNGPSGSAKTTTMHVLCREFDVQLIELPTASIFKEEDYVANDIDDLELSCNKRYQGRMQSVLDNDEESSKFARPLYEESQQNRFHRFLIGLNVYRKTVFDSDNDDQRPRKLLLIEDIPQIFHMHPDKLHNELLSLYERFGERTVPTVFIISDSVNGPSVEFKVLPDWLQTSLKMQVISFKPVSEVALKKAIARVNKSTLNGMLTSEAIDEVVVASGSDVRHAFNYLAFSHSQSVPSSSKVSKKGSSSSKTKTSTTSTTTTIESGREDHLKLSHAVAKLMYAKRFPEKADPAAVEYFTSKPQADRTLLRNVLEYEKPEMIAEQANAPADTLLDWSYENYIDFLTPGADDLNHAVEALEVLSLADSLRDYESRASMEAIRSSYVIRGQMFALNQDASAYGELGPKRDDGKLPIKRTFSFHPLRKPIFAQQRRAMTANLGQLVALKESAFYRGVCFESDKNLVMDVLPAVVGSSIRSVTDRIAALDGSLRAFASDMAHFTGGYDFDSRHKAKSYSSEGQNEGFIELSSQQQYNRANLPFKNRVKQRSPFLQLNALDGSDEESSGEFELEVDSDLDLD